MRDRGKQSSRAAGPFLPSPERSLVPPFERKGRRDEPPDPDGRLGWLDVPLTQQLRLESLAHANTVRYARAQLKRDLAGGSVELAEILEDSPVWTQNMKVRVLLLAVPGIGPTKADRALTSCQIPHSKTVAGLSGRQEAALFALFRR